MTAAMISTALLDYLNILFKAEENPEVYGYILAIFMLTSYIGSALSFLRAGVHYRDFMNGLS